MAIYTRVSTTSQVGGRFDSCESQAAICRDYITRHAAEGWHEIACYTDAAYSGGTMNRPGITALKRQIAAGEVRVVLIFKLERMLRSTDEWAPFRSFLQQHGCKLVSTTEDLTEDTPSGRLKNNIMVSVAEYERLNTAEKVRAKMLEQAKRGYWNYGLVPFGYGYDEKKQLLQPDPGEAAVVRGIFDEAARLVPLNRIADRLDREGRRTRARQWSSRDGSARTVGGTRFRTDILRALLRNPIYAGRIRFLNKDYPGKHEALVSPELWEQANAALADPKPLSRDLFRSSNVHGYFLKGLLHCAHCQRALMPWTSSARGDAQKRFRYYVCGSFTRERHAADCPVRAVPARALESAVVGFIGGIARHPDLLRRAVEESRVRGQRERGPLRERLAQLDREIATVTRQINNCVDAVVHGGTDALADELRNRARSLKDKKYGLTVQHEQARQELAACEQELLGDDRIRGALRKFGEVFPDLAVPEQSRLMQLCVDRIEVTGRAGAARGRRFELALRLPVARLVEGMEEQLVVETRAARLERRTLTLPLTVGTEPGGGVSILRPFHLPMQAGRPENPAPAVTRQRHALHRALEWQRLRARLPRMTTADFARQVRVSPATVDFHFGLLRLAPEIQAFLLQLRDRASIRRFGLLRLLPLARLEPIAQRTQFAALLAPGEVLPAPSANGAVSPGIRRSPRVA